MDQHTIGGALSNLPLGNIYYFERVNSTNDIAAELAAQGAPELSLVVAEEQTAGRGRAGRKWYTRPSCALAFSLIMRPTSLETPEILPRLSALGALAISETLEAQYQLSVQIKWPNDVLIDHRKVSGVLAEAHWSGESPSALILGIGINVRKPSIPPANLLNYPATCLEVEFGEEIDRLDLLRNILETLLKWRPHLHSPAFIEIWQERLAYRGSWVQVSKTSEKPIEAKIIGLTPEGHLRLQTRSGSEVVFHAGEIHILPFNYFGSGL